MTRNIVVCILLSIITCGIYGLYWMYTLNEYARAVAPQEWQTSGITVILLDIITCGIYGLYWNYKMGKAYMAVNGGSDNSLLFVLLGVFGFSIVNWAIMQNDINNAARFRY
ncbi:DUF4234 domain-containing protein [uncultured Allofournierella sp.]|uniref:DUF4234 domain-containing protein n=1 Tax=uncultured Allofournierella sp. TaxID=1940258 RepID=UPI0025EDB600|nr:DUF4234 domain-containing protein [uncultured Fournierella sp.]